MLPQPRHDLYHRLKTARHVVIALENTDYLGPSGHTELRQARSEVERIRAELTAHEKELDNDD
jgi:hypothetical protein